MSRKANRPFPMATTDGYNLQSITNIETNEDQLMEDTQQANL